MQDVFGGNKCTYDEVSDIVDRSNECNKDAQEKWAAKVKDLDGRPDKK